MPPRGYAHCRKRVSVLDLSIRHHPARFTAVAIRNRRPAKTLAMIATTVTTVAGHPPFSAAAASAPHMTPCDGFTSTHPCLPTAPHRPSLPLSAVTTARRIAATARSSAVLPLSTSALHCSNHLFLAGASSIVVVVSSIRVVAFSDNATTFTLLRCPRTHPEPTSCCRTRRSLHRARLCVT